MTQRPIVLSCQRKKSAWTEDGELKVSAKMQNSSFRYLFFDLLSHIETHSFNIDRLAFTVKDTQIWLIQVTMKIINIVIL